MWGRNGVVGCAPMGVLRAGANRGGCLTVSEPHAHLNSHTCTPPPAKRTTHLLGHGGDELDDALGHLIPRRGLAPDDAHARDHASPLRPRQLPDGVIAVHDAQHIQQLALVLVDALDLCRVVVVGRVGGEWRSGSRGRAALQMERDSSASWQQAFVAEVAMPRTVARPRRLLTTPAFPWCCSPPRPTQPCSYAPARPAWPRGWAVPRPIAFRWCSAPCPWPGP